MNTSPYPATKRMRCSASRLVGCRLERFIRTLPSNAMPQSAPMTLLAVHDQLNTDERGAVFTKAEVVDFILDLAGYDTHQKLYERRLLEPSCGHGEFVLAAIDRLMDSYWKHHESISPTAISALGQAIRAVEAHEASARETEARVVDRLVGHGLSQKQARSLAAAWIVVGDFLLADLGVASFDFVVGNPPYVRQELIPDHLLAIYRERFSTLYNRADLYVPFFERGLNLLSTDGKLCFICSDRWMKCAYGKPLRAMIARDFHLDAFVDMVDTPAFQSEVIAYPAITLLSRLRPSHNGTLAAYRPKIDRVTLSPLARALTGHADSALKVQRLEKVVDGHQPWLLDSNARLDVVRALEARLPLLEDVGCKVGIGVATGCDRAYIGDFKGLEIEPTRKLPLVMAGDIRSGRIEWGGHGVINPFERDGTLASLEEYPKFGRLIQSRADLLKARNVAKRAGQGWYRTIDRIWHDLTSTPKLLIPDIKGEANVVYDKGDFYPHHNLYWVTAAEWDLRALQCVLRSAVAKAFVATYCVKMAGGFLRFQAQYLRRIRVPEWRTVDAMQRRALVSAAKSLDQTAIDNSAFDLYGLSSSQRKVLLGFHDGHGTAHASGAQ